MREHERYRLNSPHVVAEAIEGSGAGMDEAIVVNLDSGTYYSLSGDGILVWDAFTAGATLDEIVAAVAAQTGARIEAVQPTLASFCGSLLAEGLIVLRDGEPEPFALDFSGAGQGLLVPSLDSYTDMQDLILLDPVHEVDAQGWPHVQAGI